MPTQSEIADHLDMSRPAVSQLMGELGIDWTETPLDDIRVAYIRRLRKVAAGHESAEGDNLIRERVLNERADRELKELTLAEKKSQLVNVAKLEPELMQMVVAFRTDVLALPDRLKDEIDALYGIDVDLQLLTDPIYEVLEQLARYDPEHPRARAPAGVQGGASGAHVDDGLGASVSEAEPQGNSKAGPVQPGPDAMGTRHAPGAGRSGGVESGRAQERADRVD